jgi:hypothetical protein
MRNIIIILICLIVIKNYNMEPNSRELAHIDALLDIIEAETTYPNPDAPYRIHAACNKLMACSRVNVAKKWKFSCARANAAKLVFNSKKVMGKYNGTSLETSSQMLYIQAQEIFLAVTLIDEKISLLK